MPPHAAPLRRLASQVLEAPDLDGLARLLTQALPAALRVASATLLVWNRRLDAFQALVGGETRIHTIRPEGPGVRAPDARYLIFEGQLIETRESGGEGALLPLMARAGLAGMLVLGPRRGRRRVPYRSFELRLLSAIAARAALALENSLYQRELIESERVTALGSMAGMLAHDLRGPMTVIRGYAETLADGGHTDAEVRERAAVIVRMIDQLDRMTSETLDFARGGARLALVRVDLHGQLEEWVRDLGERLPGLDVCYDLHVPPGVLVLIDPDKLRRALLNVAANAHEAMGGAGRFHVRAAMQPARGAEPSGEAGPPGGTQAAREDRPARLVIDLADEGPGIPAQIRERLFEPFVTHGKKHGTGLGLTVTRRFIEDHDGTIELLPDGPGACFRIELPLVTPEHAPEE